MEESKTDYSIFYQALFSGILGGIGLKVGYSPTETGAIQFIVDLACRTGGGVNPQADCSSFLFTVSFLFSIVTALSLLSLILKVRKTGNWESGISMYIIGFTLGMLIMYIIL